MASEFQIFRPSTEAEQKDFVELGRKNSLDLFLDKVAKLRLDYDREFKPFCTSCARVEFEKAVRDAVEENTLTAGKAVTNKVVSLDNLEQYGADNRFDLLKVRDIRQDKILDGVKITSNVGKEFSFRCKVRGCGQTVFVPTLDLPAVEARLKKEVKKE